MLKNYLKLKFEPICKVKMTALQVVCVTNVDEEKGEGSRGVGERGEGGRGKLEEVCLMALAEVKKACQRWVVSLTFERKCVNLLLCMQWFINCTNNHWACINSNTIILFPSTWLIVPVVTYLSQRWSHECPSTNSETARPPMAH